jgi:hypothetical protein
MLAAAGISLILKFEKEKSTLEQFTVEGSR